MSETGRPLLHEGATQTQLNSVLLKDFYNGIRFAQGNDYLHPDIYALLRFRYGMTWAPSALEALPAGFAYVQEMSERFFTPKSHSQKIDSRGERSTAQDFIGTLDIGWRVGTEALKDCIEGDPPSDAAADYKAMRHDVMERMINVDSGWVQRGRPSRQEGEDAHSSQIREYVLGGHNTNSTFDAIFQEMRRDMADGVADHQTAKLRLEWESRPGHEQLQFYPSACPPEIIAAQEMAYSQLCFKQIGAIAIGD
jgi:hypothetical protein